MVPLHGEAGDGAEEVGLLPIAIEILERLGDEQLRLSAGALPAEQGDEGLFAARPVLADLLASLGLLSLLVEEIVGDLEGEADVAGIAPQPRAALRRNPADDRSGFEAEADQRSCLQLLQ